ncbi:MAG TPA: UDP-N-acetylmuramate dehydrogenase [Thermomicrobiales bacterium]|nr:UDP-N-acetylmuramate dehydrogenase [Thermomicrobiales bacterium]
MTDTTLTLAVPGTEKPLKIEQDAPLSRCTTWRIGGPADFQIRATTPDALIAAVQWGNEQGLPITVIGGGSNLLVSDAGLRGLVIISKTIGERSEALLGINPSASGVELTAAAQVPISWIGRYACDQGWQGLDWAVGLPGTVGGATVNNAGAHGTELKDYLVAIRTISLRGEITSSDRTWLTPTYRNTTIKAQPRPRDLVLLDATFHLPHGDTEALMALAEDHARYRKETQPTGACAGSTFANPPGEFAGRLIEAAGLKGYAIGPVSFSAVHSNFIVNAGGGTAQQVLELIVHAQTTVREQFGIELHREIEYLEKEHTAP